jgi:hypothetical protein
LESIYYSYNALVNLGFEYDGSGHAGHDGHDRKKGLKIVAALTILVHLLSQLKEFLIIS